MSAHKKNQLKAQNKELAVDRYMHVPMMGMHNNEQTLKKKNKNLSQWNNKINATRSNSKQY